MVCVCTSLAPFQTKQEPIKTISNGGTVGARLTARGSSASLPSLLSQLNAIERRFSGGGGGGVGSRSARAGGGAPAIREPSSSPGPTVVQTSRRVDEPTARNPRLASFRRNNEPHSGEGRGAISGDTLVRSTTSRSPTPSPPPLITRPIPP